MDVQTVRDHAQALCDSLLAGDVDRAAADLSHELRSNLGAFLTLLPLPLTEANIESVEHAGSGYMAVLRLIGESASVGLNTRWKDRDGRPTIVEASHTAEASHLAEAAEPTDETGTA